MHMEAVLAGRKSQPVRAPIWPSAPQRAPTALGHSAEVLNCQLSARAAGVAVAASG